MGRGEREGETLIILANNEGSRGTAKEVFQRFLIRPVGSITGCSINGTSPENVSRVKNGGHINFLCNTYDVPVLTIDFAQTRPELIKH